MRRVCKLMEENMEVVQFERYPSIDFLNRDCLKTLHQIFDIKVPAGNVCRKTCEATSLQRRLPVTR